LSCCSSNIKIFFLSFALKLSLNFKIKDYKINIRAKLERKTKIVCVVIKI
jgi:hypothetical protein